MGVINSESANNVTGIMEECKLKLDGLVSETDRRLERLSLRQECKGADFRHRSSTIQEKFYAAIESLKTDYPENAADQGNGQATLLLAQKQKAANDILKEAELTLQAHVMVAIIACIDNQTGCTLDLQSGSDDNSVLEASTFCKVLHDLGLTKQFKHVSLSGGSAIQGIGMALGTTIDDDIAIEKISGDRKSAINELNAAMSSAVSLFLVQSNNADTFRNYCTGKGVAGTQAEKIIALGQPSHEPEEDSTSAAETNVYHSDEMLTFSDLKLLHECFPEQFKTVSITLQSDDSKSPEPHCAETHGNLPIALAAIASSTRHNQPFHCIVDDQKQSLTGPSAFSDPKQFSFSFKWAPLTRDKSRPAPDIRRSQAAPRAARQDTNSVSGPVSAFPPVDWQAPKNSGGILEGLRELLKCLGIEIGNKWPLLEAEIGGTKELNDQEQETFDVFPGSGFGDNEPDAKTIQTKIQMLEALVPALWESLAQELQIANDDIETHNIHSDDDDGASIGTNQEQDMSPEVRQSIMDKIQQVASDFERSRGFKPRGLSDLSSV